MSIRVLLPIYSMFYGKGRRVSWIDQRIVVDHMAGTSSDEKKNEPEMYATLFSGKNKLKLELIYLSLMKSLGDYSYDQCGDELDALEFIQEISSVALWKYRQNIGEILENFVRDFDRLDVQAERVRLYSSARI